MRRIVGAEHLVPPCGVRRLALLLAPLALLVGASGCADGDDQVQAGGLRGLLTAEQPVVEQLPEQHTEVTTIEVEVDPEAEDGYGHSLSALDVLGDDPELDELAVDCFQADLSACDVLYDASPPGSLYDTYAATCGARIDEPTNRLCVDVLLPPADDWEDLGPDAFLDELAKQCHDGDLLDCDLLFAEADRGTQYEAYGATCGGRVDGDADSVDEDCTLLFAL